MIVQIYKLTDLQMFEVSYLGQARNYFVGPLKIQVCSKRDEAPYGLNSRVFWYILCHTCITNWLLVSCVLSAVAGINLAPPMIEVENFLPGFIAS